MRPKLLDAYQLFHAGALALAEVEHNGIRVDVEYVTEKVREIGARIRTLEVELRKDEVYRVWQKRFGLKANLSAPAQLGTVMFDILGYKRSLVSEEEEKDDEAAFENVDLPFIKTYFEMKHLGKTQTTFNGIAREVVRGRAHCNYNLNIPVSYRSSCNDFNFQNLPVRDPTQAQLIREAFLPTGDDWSLIESDLSGAEVRVSACYNKDPQLIKYICDKSTDMHRDMASQIFMLDSSRVTKMPRYCAKNMYVFPEFYGSYYVQCARNLWNAIDKFQLKNGDDDSAIGMKEHLKAKGIKGMGNCVPGQDPKPGTFESHLKKVEQDFWGRRFKVYSQWKKRWYEKFLSNDGCFDTLTGFHYEGALINRKQVINYPIQGSAFHLILWAITQLQRKIFKYKMRSKIVGQIHDSIVGDVYKKERRQWVEMIYEIITVDLPKHWDWIIVPLETEVDVSPLGESWFKKKPLNLEKFFSQGA